MVSQLSEATWTTTVTALLMGPAAAHLWLLPTDTGWELPHIQLDRRLWLSDAGAVQTAFRVEWGFRGNVLACVEATADDANRSASCIFVLHHTGSPAGLRGDGGWYPLADLEIAPFRNPQFQTTALAWRSRLAPGQSGPRPQTWYTPGWHSSVQAWVDERLTAAGRETAPLEQVRSWGISTVLRIPTTQEDFYFKTGLQIPLFANEAQVTAALSRLAPDQITPVIDVLPEQNWMLMADLGTEVGWGAEVSVQGQVLQEYGAFQVSMTDHVATLFAAGCLDRRLPVLEAQLDGLVEASRTWAVLTEPQLDELHSLIPEYRQMCRALAGFSIPDSLVHGDLHMSNVAYNGDTFRFFDWTDACIAHPFLDMHALFANQTEADRERLRDRYLDRWAAFESRERLLEAWQLASPLIFLHQAVSYAGIVLHGHTDPWDDMQRGWREFLLRSMHQMTTV